MPGPKLPELYQLNAVARRQFSHWEDFYHYTTAEDFTTVVSDLGTAAASDAHGGVLVILPSDASVTDNDEGYVRTTHEIFKFDADNTIRVAALLQFTEGATDDANVIFGLMDAAGPDALQDNGLGPKASFSGAVFYKVDGQVYWRVRSSVGTTNTDTALTTHTAGTAAGVWTLLEIEVRAIALTRVEITYRINEQLVLDPAAGYAKPLLHTLDATSATEMHLVVGMKNGAATTVETLRVDGLGWDVIR